MQIDNNISQLDENLMCILKKLPACTNTNWDDSECIITQSGPLIQAIWQGHFDWVKKQTNFHT